MATIFKSYRKESKIDWGTDKPINESLNNEQLKLGAILRIADATEVMAKRHTELIADRDLYKRWWEDERKKTERLQRQVNAYRGLVKKMKAKEGKP
jgi:hypothetical protein